MKDLNEVELKIKFNNYMEQIKVPENLGGIIMEDFEKMKNEENQNGVENQGVKDDVKQQNENISSNVKKKKSNKVLKISLGSVAAVVLVGAGIFVGTRLVGDKNITFNNHGAQNSNLAGESQAEVKSDITAEESKKILSFLNSNVNNPFTQTNYDNPEGLLKNVDKSHEFILKYAIFNTNNKYATVATDAQKSKLNLADMPYKFISEENLIKFLKEKMNYTYSADELRSAFTYKESEKGYLDMISDSAQSNVTMENGGYKLGNKYYFTVNNENNKKIELVLIDNEDSYYFYSAKIENQSNTVKTDTEQNNVTESEISEIEKFVNDKENQVFALINYNNPADLFTNKYNEHNIGEIIRYSLNESKYAIPSTTDQNKIIWGKNTAEISTKIVEIRDIIKFLNEKINYTYSDNDIRKYFTINSKLDKYVLMVSDTLFTNFKVKSLTKENDKYLVKLSPAEGSITSKDIDVVLTKENGKYYFYSCNLNNVEKLTQDKISKLEKFINEPENNAFVNFEYNNADNIFDGSYNAKKIQTVALSLIEGGYAKLATQEEKNAINYNNVDKAVYTISIDELNNFFINKLATSFDDEELKKAFKYEYKQQIGKVVLLSSGALSKDDKIIDAYKIGEFNNYYLTLSRGQTVAICERNDGSIVFELCQNVK